MEQGFAPVITGTATRRVVAVLLAAVAVLSALYMTVRPSTAAAAAATRQSTWVQFWASVGNGKSANCYISSFHISENDPYLRCDKYHIASDGTVTQGAELVIHNGHARRIHPTDATDYKAGRHLRAGDSLHKLRFRCTSKRTVFVCRDTHTHHGFRITQDAFGTF